MGYSLEEAMDTLRNSTDYVVHYQEVDRGDWIRATNRCVPHDAYSIKTKQGAYWTKADGWISNREHMNREDKQLAEKGVEILRNEKEVIIDISHFNKLALSTQLSLVKAIAELDEIKRVESEEKKKEQEFTKFYETVIDLMPAFGIRVAYNIAELPRSEVQDRFRRILRSAWYGERK